MGKIVAIGGGEIKSGQTLELDRFIVDFSGKSNPRILFVPTASHDAGGYVNVVSRVYRRLGCSFSSLLYFLDKNAPLSAPEKVDAADIIYVGGGNTRLMLDTWSSLGFDNLLKNAFDSGKVFCGISAGSICWFSSGYSDSPSPSDPSALQFHELTGLGMIDAVHCPHYDEPGREGFDSFMKIRSGVGIAVNNGSALAVQDDNAMALGNGVFKLSEQGKAPVPAHWTPLNHILEKE